MCGGYKIYSKKISIKELEKFFSIEQAKEIQNHEYFENHFWDERPILPAEDNGKILLFDWGNRDTKAPFPLTGWAKKESIDKGKWQWLKPRRLTIPIDRGLDKKIWFDMPEGTEGLLVEKEGDRRLYMITEESDADFRKLIDHDRMPLGQKTNYLK